MTVYAYARVSAQDQNIARQIDAFHDFGVNDKQIYTDKKSGKDFERDNYKKLLRKLKSGDLLVIKSIDRLGRNYDSIINEWKHITNDIKADIIVMDMPLLDTRVKADNLVGKFISNIVLQVLSFVAENERSNIKQRQKEGIISAQNRGVRFGRPLKHYSDEFINAVRDFNNNTISIKDALLITKLKRCNLYYHVHRLTELGYL